MIPESVRVGRDLKVTRTFAEFVSECGWQDIPQPVRHEAKRALLNFFAVALSACHDPTIEKAVRVLGRFSAGAQASLIGRAERVDSLTAAALNAMSANVFDFDDTHIPTIIHPTAPVAPAILALAETSAVTGRDFLTAFILGVEVECRLGNAISPYHYARGWHITSTCGIFGAAAACAKVLRLDVRRLTWAMGAASSQASGLVETLGTMAKSMGVGNAARNGLLSAFLAREDFDGPAHPLEGERGFLHVMGNPPDLAAAVAGLGDQWEILNNTYKPYPCGVVLNPVIDACLDLSAEHDLSGGGLDEVESIEITGHPLLRQRTDRPDVKTGRASQVSAQHAVAVALARGKPSLTDFTDTAVADPALRILGGKVRFRDDAAYPVEAATVTIRRRQRTPVTVTIDMARGSKGNPLTDRDIENKLRELCHHGVSGCDPEPLMAAIWELDQQNRACTLAQLARARNSC